MKREDWAILIISLLVVDHRVLLWLADWLPIHL
jgi:hypothetical protein